MFNHTHRSLNHITSATCRIRPRVALVSSSRQSETVSLAALTHRRGGAVIIVVLALLSLMIFLGVFFFEFTQEEQLAAQNYVSNTSDGMVSPEPYFEEALSQLIIGPSASRTMSPLAAGEFGVDDFTAPTSAGISYGTPGTPYSLLAHVIGRMQRTANGLKPTDVIPHNGHGISVQFVDNNSDGVFDPSEYVRFDMDGDGSVDAALDPTDASNLGVPQFGINFSRPAQLDPANDAFSQSTSTNALRPFQPDVEYTYPDINNLFLAYERVDPTTGRRILVPSFHRPDLFPSMRNSGFGDLYTDSATTRLVMRPHREHRYADNTPGNRSDNVRRYLTNPAGTQAESGDTSRVIFPFPFQVDSDNDGVYNEMGIYSNVSGTEVGYDLDVDLTGDGKPDGIWIDSGYGLIDLPDGRQMVPMFSFHVIDADSLININSAGNLQGVLVNGVDYDSGMPFSVSNTGASASEINVLRALTGEPDSYPLSDMTARQKVFAEHLRIYSSLDISQPISPLTMANMELAFTLGGRIQSRSSARLSGRYGEQKLIGTGTSPAPGITGVDDDLDNTPDSARYQGGAQRTRSIYDPRGGGGSVDVVIPYASHPIAPKGTGSSSVTSSGAKAGQRVVATAVSGSPVVFPQYPNSSTPTPNSGWETPQSGAVLGTAVPAVSAAYPYPGAPISDPLGSTLFPSGTNGMTDEEDETRLRNPDRIYDDIFRPEENMTFQLSDADRQRMGGNTRAEMIAPFNFKYAHDSQDIRKRFTTDSWDLSELTYVPGRYSSGYTETSEWVSGSGRRFFPPVFSPTLPGVLDGTDPFRPEVRALLATEDTSWTNAFNSRRREDYDFKTAYGGTTPPGLQDDTPLWRQRLNLNKLLVGFDVDGYPIYRDLMPHPDIYETFKTTSSPTITIPPMIHGHNAAIPASASLTNISSGTIEQKVTAQEWWARYDRQRMARDIYTLLYLVGAPDIDFDATTPMVKDGPVTKPYPNSIKAEMTREMAQFAVNYVDALDRDDVITKFEYDDDLSNGWSNSPSKHVYGIERASLSFSEVQFLQTKPRTNTASTLHNDDSLNVHQYLHMELRNSSPFEVDLAEGWRISRVKRDTSTKLGTGTRDKSVEFKTKSFGTSSADAKYVTPGGNFLIGTHDGHVVNGSAAPICSDLYADVENGAELELILPSSPTAAINTVNNDSADPDPVTNLDLGVESTHPHYQYFTHVNGDATSEYQDPTLAIPLLSPAQTPPTHLVRQIEGTISPPTPAVPETGLVFDLVLERRQNPHGVNTGGDSSSMGDWIEVDRFEVRSSDMVNPTPGNAILEIANPGGQTEVLAGLLNLNSMERRQPFDPVQFPHVRSAARNHTMVVTAASAPSHAANSAFSGTSFTLWQPHFDRDLTSAYELLSVPLYGNWPLTELVAGTQTGVITVNTFYKEIHGGTQFNLAPGASGSSSGRLSGDFTAGIRFNFPNGIPGRPYQGWNPFNYQNAWYRLFDFVTVPRRADQQSEEIIATVPGSTKPVFRVPGKINLNTLRDETVLAALLDDETHLTYGNATQDYVTAGRNWYQELLQSRDGVDYFAKAAGLPTLAIPNSIDSRPFRNSSKLDPYATSTVDDGVENGLLRSSIFRGATALPPRPNGTAYTTPTLVSPTDFTSTGLGAGTLSYNTNSLNWQGLFDSGDLANTGIDHHTRNRILAKIANNSTTKSHVFFVWTAVGYFEAHRTTTGYVQVGARLTDIPIHRRFSVVDMSKLDEAYNTSSNTFDEEAFIIFQKRLR
ncbi:MAG: hypothetical protein U0929_20685 [Planctomycetaceae bacterium]